MIPEHVTDAVLVAPGDRRDEAREVAAGYLARFKGASRKNHTVALEQWFEFCAANNIPVLGAKRGHADIYSRWMEETKGYMRSTVCAKQSVLMGFYAYAVEEGYLPVSPVQYLKRDWPERVSTTKHLTRHELGQVLNLAQAAPNPHDHAVICLLGYNGLRVGELVNINIEHLGEDRWYPTVFLPNRKGGKTQTVPLHARTNHAVQLVVGTRTEGPLFVMPSGKRMDRNQAARIVKRLAKWAGVTKKISPHSLRHSFITLSLQAGANTRDVMNSAGHADERMVAYYDRAKDNLARNTTHTVAAFVEGVE